VHVLLLSRCLKSQFRPSNEVHFICCVLSYVYRVYVIIMLYYINVNCIVVDITSQSRLILR